MNFSSAEAVGVNMEFDKADFQIRAAQWLRRNEVRSKLNSPRCTHSDSQVHRASTIFLSHFTFALSAFPLIMTHECPLLLC